MGAFSQDDAGGTVAAANPALARISHNQNNQSGIRVMAGSVDRRLAADRFNTMEHSSKVALETYDRLWREAVAALAQGKPDIDPYLCDKSGDPRRGVTLVARPSQSVRDRARDYLERLALVCPGQYFYRPEELHVTVLSVISGSQSWRREIRQLASYRAIIGAVLRRRRSFRIRFRGITASPGCVMIQGFPVGDGLAGIRNALRTAFARAGFAGVLDRRYRIHTAHITAMRFRQPGVDAGGLLALLEEGRQMDFGDTHVTHLELIWGDWYASSNIVRTLREYRLKHSASVGVELTTAMGSLAGSRRDTPGARRVGRREESPLRLHGQYNSGVNV